MPPEQLPVRVVRHSIAAFRRSARSWLLEREAEHNLLLGLLEELHADSSAYEEPIYLATVEQDGAVVGCAFRTPPFKLGLTDLPADAIDALVDDVSTVYDTLPAVMGSPESAARFARAWARRRGVEAKAGMHQRLHLLERVIEPARPTSGEVRAATAADVELIAEWLGAFAEESGVPSHRPRQLALRLIEGGSVFLWLDSGPVSMTAVLGATPRGVRIGYVYTPKALRGRGYATWLVARVSRQQLDRGRSFCVLYTDLANPTSNALYRRLGYRPLADVIDYTFD